MTDNIKPCPFCGGMSQRVKHSRNWGWFVSCGTCAAAGPGSDLRDGAIIRWNKRKPLPPHQEPMQMALSFADQPTLLLAT